MKEVIGKTKLSVDEFPKKLSINNEEIFNKQLIANHFNNYFINVGSNLAAKIPHSEKHFTSYLVQSKEKLENNELNEKEFKKAFDSLKPNKSSGFDEINPNVVRCSYGELFYPLFHICKQSIKFGIFPDKMKIAKIKPVFKSGETEIVSNYRPISILPVFSKLLERIMYNRLYSHVTSNNLLYEKQFGFQNKCSTEYAILQLAKEIYSSFNENEYTLGIFIDLSKAFDTVNHNILLTKLKYFGLTEDCINWFKSYLSNRKQYIFYGDRKRSSSETINCGVPQGSILGPLLFLLYVNDLYKASNLIKPIMFADDTNLFYSARCIKQLFSTMNHELTYFQTWFNANKLSLNVTKTKYSFFHPLSRADQIPLRLPELKINNVRIERETTTKFLGVLLDENMTWRNHIACVENKITKNLGLLYKARHLLNTVCTKQLYFSFIHYSYLNYANIVWASTNKSKLKTLLRRQKHAARIIHFKNKYIHARPLLQNMEALNVYQLNIQQTLLFMHKVKHGNIPNVFKNSFPLNSNKYGTKSTKSSFYKPFFKNRSNQFSIAFRGPHLWNTLIQESIKDLPFHTFKNKLKEITINLNNEDGFF